MNYPPLPPTKNTPPRRRPTNGQYPADIDNYPSSPRPRPVNQIPFPARQRGGHVASPPVNGGGGRYSKTWQAAAQHSATGYDEPKSTLVYPEDALYEDARYDYRYEDAPSPPQRYDGREYDGYGGGYNDGGQEALNHRPLPAPPVSPYPPRLPQSPYEEQYSTFTDYGSSPTYHGEVQDPFEDPPHRELSIRRSPSVQDIADHLDMPSPTVDSSQDVLHPLPPTPRSPPYMHSPPLLDTQPNLNRRGSSNRPGTRSSTSSMYSYNPDLSLENDYHDNYFADDYSTTPTSLRSNSIGRSGTILSVQKPSYSNLHVETDDLRPVPPPPPPPHLQYTSPSSPPRSDTMSTVTNPPIYRSRTEPGHYRAASADLFAPPPPPKIPLDGHSRQPSLNIGRSQSHASAIIRSPSYPSTSYPSYDQQRLGSPEDTILSPVTESKTFPLSSRVFQQCTEPWSLSALLYWIQEIFGRTASMETISLALEGLFTHHVSTLSTVAAGKLASQVGETWLREGVLFEPTIANTAEWNPLSTLEMEFMIGVSVSGVLPTLTGRGCYSTICPTAAPGLGRCYSPRCSRTLTKRSQTLPTLPTTSKASDWASFWSPDPEVLRTLDKREIKRQNVIFELIQGEEEYVADLGTLLNLFQKQIITSSTGQVPIIPKRRLDAVIKTVFGQVKPLLECQSKLLLMPLRERQAHQGPVVKGIGDIILEWARGCRLAYVDYAGAYPYADATVREEKATNALFASWLERCQADPACRRLDINHFLQTPNRRIARVSLVLDSIVENTEETNRDREILQRASDQVKNVAHECDARTAETTANLKRKELDERLVFKSGNTVNLGLTDATRKVIHTGDVIRKSDNRLEWLDIHLILLDNFLVMTKKRRDRGSERYFVSKQPIPVDLLVLEGVKADPVSKSSTIGTLTTSVSLPSQQLQRGKSTKALAKITSTGSGNTSPDLPPPLVTTLSSPAVDKTLIYPFSVTHLSSDGDTYTLFAESASSRQQWVDRILEAKNDRARFMSQTEPFQASIVVEGIFGYATIDATSPPALVEASTMHRAIASLRAQPIGSKGLPRVQTLSRINCAKSFIAPDNTDYAHQRLVAVGTDDGVYIGYCPELSGLCTTWTKVLSLNKTTQIDVLEAFDVFLVLANKELIAYSLNGVIPRLPAATGALTPPPVAKQPQRLSGSHDVGFFATGKLKERMLVLYKYKKGGVNSVFKALEPVVGKADTNRKNLFSRKKSQTEFFREYDDFFVPTECFGLFTFKNTISIPTQKGFEVLTLDSKDIPKTIPDLSAPHIALLSRRLDGTKPLGMYRISESEFLLCYDGITLHSTNPECAIYVDKHGEVSRSKVINWHGKPRATQVIDGKYVLAFDTSFIEIWRCDGEFGDGGVSLVQVIPGRDIRMVGKEEKKADLGLGPGTGYYDRVYVAMGHPERGDRQVVVELMARNF